MEARMKRQTDYGYEIKPVYTLKHYRFGVHKGLWNPGSYPYVRVTIPMGTETGYGQGE
jgi:hypothetical protein